MTFRFYPTERQARQLAREFGCARYAYNWALRLRTDSFKAGVPVNFTASSVEWTKHRNDPKYEWLREASSVPQQRALRHLQTAFSNFFAKRAKYPRFHYKHGKQRAEYSSAGFKWDAGNRNLSISKVGRLNIRRSREFTSAPSTVTVTKDCAGRYFVSLCLDEPAKAALPKTGEQVVIDLGISRLATLSTGERVANPRHTACHAARLAKAQRRLARKCKGSGRWEKQRRRAARIHARVADARKDALDKLTTDLVRRFDVLAIEDLNVRGMVRNRNLAKHINCASFGRFRRMLEYKAAWYGKEVRVADRFFPSSKRCNNCGHVHTSLPLHIREFTCEGCGSRLDRDENAARNILQFARAATSPTTGGQPESKARGERVSRGRASAPPRSARRSVNQPGSAVRPDHRHPRIPRPSGRGKMSIVKPFEASVSPAHENPDRDNERETRRPPADGVDPHQPLAPEEDRLQGGQRDMERLWREEPIDAAKGAMGRPRDLRAFVDLEAIRDIGKQREHDSE